EASAETENSIRLPPGAHPNRAELSWSFSASESAARFKQSLDYAQRNCKHNNHVSKPSRKT
ncbi:hypothetical protein DD924_10085, partial [Staphylococcus pseudintermedius]